MPARIVLFHGYSGSPDTLTPLAQSLAERFGRDSIVSHCLPGHGDGQVPSFDPDAFVDSASKTIESAAQQHKPLIVLGHSTGGVIALAALIRSRVVPDLLVLASVPNKIDISYLERWSTHRSGKAPVPFTSIANMVSFINRIGKEISAFCSPVLVLHGADDDLVPVEQARLWQQGPFEGPVRIAVIPGAGHDLFRGRKHGVAIDVVMGAAADAIEHPGDDRQAALCAVEPEIGRFFAHSPYSAGHLLESPSGRTALDLQPDVGTDPAWEPVFANIEITTRCNLKCTYCARSLRGSAGEDMPEEVFDAVLGLLPHSYRITLVGLGETLLHPKAVDLVAKAASQGRRVALVTNAMLLTEDLSRELLNAGLESIAFSVDAATQEIASRVRPGTDLERVVGNIKRFVSLSRSVRPVSTAVFSAVSTDTIGHLGQLIELVSGLGVHVMMLSDLNFRENIGRTLWKTADQETAGQVRSAVSRAFQMNLPVLSVHGLEEFGLWKRYNKFLLIPPDRLYQRSALRKWCCSPWQTVPVNVRGEVTLCDCQPEVKAGDLLNEPFRQIWHGNVFREHRKRMLSDDPPEACRICPRF